MNCDQLAVTMFFLGLAIGVLFGLIGGFWYGYKRGDLAYELRRRFDR